MSNYINDLNSLIDTKKEIKNIIIDTLDENPSEVFSYYPSYLRTIAAGYGGTPMDEDGVNAYISAYLSTYNYIDQESLSSNSYLTQHQSLADYVTYSFLSSQSYISSIPSEYVTETELSGMSYATQSYVMDKIGAIPTVDLSGYVSYAYLESKQYIDKSVQELDGPLFISYATANNGQYSLNAYSHIVAGTQDKTTLSLVATKRKCGGDNGTSYMAAFFTNSDGRSKFTHKTRTNETEVGVHADDAFLCFNAYGFKLAYSGTEGTAASTEYDIIHSGNIGQYAAVTDENIIPKENNTYTLGDSSYLYSSAYISALKFNNYENQFYGADQYTITCKINGANRYSFMAGSIRPEISNVDLGSNSNPWNNTYSTKYQFAYNTYITSGSDYGITMSVAGKERYQWNMYQFSMIDNNYRNQCSLGSSGTPWAYTYTSNLYATYIAQDTYSHSIIPAESKTYGLGSFDNPWAFAYITNAYITNYSNFVWVGTAAQYAALSDYNTYQFYLVQES